MRSAAAAVENRVMREWIARVNVLLAMLSLFVLTLCRCEPAAAQRADTLGPQVRKYLKVDTPKVVLEHVQVIDGTGAAPRQDQNIYIEDGKISSITAGVDRTPSEGVTLIDLRGYSVIPGIVGKAQAQYTASS